MTTDQDEEPTLEARAPTDAERWYYERAYREPVEAIARIEGVAKFLVGATATTSGLFVAASKLALGDGGAQHGIWILPFGAWSLGILCQLLVLFPYRYRVGRNQPASWRDAFERARGIKYALLLAGGVFFIGGLLLAALPFHGG